MKSKLIALVLLGILGPLAVACDTLEGPPEPPQDNPPEAPPEDPPESPQDNSPEGPPEQPNNEP